MATATAYPHVEVDDNGMPYVRGTRFKVVQIVLDRLAYHWDAEEIQRQHPMLTLTQVYTALAYYYDHKDVLDARLAAEERADAERLATRPASDLAERIRKLTGERGRP